MKLVIVGGVAGGASAATRARRLDESAEIVLFERGPDVSFANCGLPYYVGGEIADRNKLLIVTPKRMKERYNLDVRTNSEVIAIDRSKKRIRVRDLSQGREYEETYDKLILSPGAAPIRPPMATSGLPGLHTLRNLGDVDRIKAEVDRSPKTAVVVGAGFIGLEMVENLVRRGVHTTVVELADQILPPFDREMTTPLAKHLRDRGVHLLLKHSVESLEQGVDSGIAVRLNNGEVLNADMVLLSIGVRPENQLATSCGLEVGPRGGIVVNQHMQTNDPDIYAVGDATEVEDFVTKQRTQIPLAGPANRQGRIAADHVFGRTSSYRGTQGTAVVRIFDLCAASTGASEKTLNRLHRPFKKVYIHPMDHASYFPGARQMSLKVLFEPDSGRILGAQGVGEKGVDKRIDVLATAIQGGMTVFDLEQIELSYSPQYGSAKDPINMAGFVASGLLRGDHPQWYAEEFDLAGQTRKYIDVRTAEEYSEGHVPGAINITVDDLRSRAASMSRTEPLYVYCQVGQRGYLALRILRQNGFEAYNLAGGYKAFLLTHERGA